MTAVTDMTQAIELIIGRTLQPQQLIAFADACVTFDERVRPVGYDKSAWNITWDSITGAEVVNAGSGYVVDDLLTVEGGTGTAAVLRVTTVNGSAIETVISEDAGNYTVTPTSPVTVTGGTGNGATFNLSTRTHTGTREPTNEEKAELVRALLKYLMLDVMDKKVVADNQFNVIPGEKAMARSNLE